MGLGAPLLKKFKFAPIGTPQHGDPEFSVRNKGINFSILADLTEIYFRSSREAKYILYLLNARFPKKNFNTFNVKKILKINLYLVKTFLLISLPRGINFSNLAA